MSGGGGGGRRGGYGGGRADRAVGSDGEGGVRILAVGLEEAFQGDHGGGELVAGVCVGTGGGGRLGALMVGANEATGPGGPGQCRLGEGGDGEVERSEVEGGVDRGGYALHNGVGVEGVAAGEGGGVEDAEGTERGPWGEDVAGGEGEGERRDLERGDGAGLGAVTREPHVEGEVHHGEDAEEDLQRVQVEGEDAAVDQGSAFGIEAFAKVEGGFDAGLPGEARLGQGGCAKDVVARLVGTRGAGCFGQDGGGKGRGGGGETEELDGGEEGGADETEAATDAGEDARGVGDRLRVGNDAVNVGLLSFAVAVEGRRGLVIVGRGFAARRRVRVG